MTIKLASSAAAHSSSVSATEAAAVDSSTTAATHSRFGGPGGALLGLHAARPAFPSGRDGQRAARGRLAFTAHRLARHGRSAPALDCRSVPGLRSPTSRAPVDPRCGAAAGCPLRRAEQDTARRFRCPDFSARPRTVALPRTGAGGRHRFDRPHHGRDGQAPARHRVPAAVCVAVHAVSAPTALADLRAAGAGKIVSCDTIGHPYQQCQLLWSAEPRTMESQFRRGTACARS